MDPVSLRLNAAGISQEPAASTPPLVAEVTALFDEFHLAIYRYLARMLAGIPEAEDLTQEVFFRLYEHLSQGGTITNSRSWLFRVAHNLAIDCLRRRALGEHGHRVPLDALGDFPALEAESAEDRLLADEKKGRLEAALTWLSPQQRQCLELRAEGLAYREIGEVLGIHISSVRTFIARAIAKIAERLDA